MKRPAVERRDESDEHDGSEGEAMFRTSQIILRGRRVPASCAMEEGW